MSLQTPIFNFHDIALILVVFQSLLLAGLLLTLRQGKRLSNRLLALFITATGMVALDTLLYWCAPLKQLYLGDSPATFFLFKFAPLVQGPLLYFYVKSLIYTDFRARGRDLVHFAPALACPAIIAAVFTSLGPDQLRAGVHDYTVYWDNLPLRSLILGQAILVLGYALAALKLMLDYNQRLRENYSSLGGIERRWLKILIMGFSLICLWNLLIQLLGSVASQQVASFMGLSGNYLNFLFINLLVFYNLLHSNVVQGIRDPEGPIQTAPAAEPAEDPAAEERKDTFAPAQIRSIERAMTEDRVYLTPDLTLEQLATSANLPARTTSNIINRHFNMSFFDFVNYHRVEAAKALLIAEPDKSVLEISELAGFNSKSAFNRFFKKFAGVTPTEFRKESSAQT
jgi:AraC-like DNA-binding protein